MKPFLAASIALATIALASTSRAQEGERSRVQLGGAIGWMFPAGCFEQGDRASDETFGVVALSVDGALRVHPRVSIGLFFQYGIVTPKLCATSSDCSSSLGRDVALAPLVRWHVARFGVVAPSIDFTVGYEWFSSKLSDSGVTSTRGHRGVLFGLDAFCGFALSPHVTLGPMLGLAIGFSDHTSIDAPGVSTSSSVDAGARHLWPRLGARVVVEL
jgi:hypothetical protein